MQPEDKLEEKEAEIIEIIEPTIGNESDFENILPKMNIAVPTPAAVEPAKELISDEQYLGIMNEAMGNIRDDRKQVSELLDNFANMVINEGDATSASKEALVNLVKIKADMSDKMLKTLDLIGRLKSKNTYAYSGAHLNALQQNNINIGSDTPEMSRKEIIRAAEKAIQKAKKKKE